MGAAESYIVSHDYSVAFPYSLSIYIRSLEHTVPITPTPPNCLQLPMPHPTIYMDHP